MDEPREAKAKVDARARQHLAEAYGFLRSRKTTLCARFPLDAAIQDRIVDIELQLGTLDGLVQNLTALAEKLRDE